MNGSQNKLVILGFAYDWQKEEKSFNRNKSLVTKALLNLSIKGILVNASQ